MQVKFPPRHSVLLALVVFAISGCTAYEPAPLELRDHAQTFRDRSLESARSAELVKPALEAALTLLKRSDLEELPHTDGQLGLEDAERLTLVLNRDVRVARARAAGRSATVNFAGLLDDPTLDVDVLRVIEDVEEPWILGSGIGFTIPLSGRHGLERKLAAAESGVAWYEAVKAEFDALLELRRRWLAWSVAVQRVELINDYLKALEPLQVTAKHLAEAGEIGPVEGQVLAIEAASRRAELVRAEAQTAELRAAVLDQIGLSPVATIDLTPYTSVELSPSHYVSLMNMADIAEPTFILDHPAALTAKARHASAERQLELEVRRQVPDLVVGPRYESEDDQNRIGLGLSLVPIPVFNRNRQGIARAEAERDLARVEAETTVEALLSQYDQARTRLNGSMARWALLVEDVLPLVEAQQESIRRLAALGEVDVLLLIDVFQASLHLHLDVLDANETTLGALNLVGSYLLAPNVVSSTATTRPTRRKP